MTVWLLLACSGLTSLGVFALYQANEAARADVKAALRRHGVVGSPMAVVVALCGWVALALWTVYAAQVGDWRFAAIPWAPLVARFLAWAMNHQTRAEVSR